MKFSARLDGAGFRRVEDLLARARRRAIARLEAQRSAEAERRAEMRRRLRLQTGDGEAGRST